MCGINGIISLHNISNIKDRIVKMNLSIAHRGPDADNHLLIGTNVALGHRRLSILDLDERSNQPMKIQSGKWIIVFNGEIFNFQTIRKELSDIHNFTTTSDTEVLLAAIEFKGIDWILKKANGMFAFVAYNIENQDFYLVRDRFGIKPLFFTIVNNTLIFSSEIKGILHSGLLQPEFNHEAIDDYLANRYVREPDTFFKKIHQVKSSTYLHFNKNLECNETEYWQLPDLNLSASNNSSDLIEETDEQIQKAFKRWFISDVPVGAYLSGGVDSSLTTAILSKTSDHRIDTYTIGFEQKEFNEFSYAKKVADIYGTNHKEILFDPSSYFGNWERLIEFKDAPLAVPNEVPLAHMSSVLSSDITVVISGEGADELFGGYGKIFRSGFDFENHNNEQRFYDYFVRQYEYVSRPIRDLYLSVNTTDKREEFDNRIASDFSLHKNDENIFRFFHKYHIQGLLQRVDMTTMQTGVEARPPFLDHELIEFVYSRIPYDQKLHWNSVSDEIKAKSLYAQQYSEVLDTPKYILKKVAEKYLPNDIIYRKKMGFPVPLSQWFPNLVQQADILKDSGWLKSELLTSLIDDLKQNPRSGQLLWMFINIQLFHDKYFNKNWLW